MSFDATDFAPFAHGPLGNAHGEAHRLWESGRFDEGRRMLAVVLAERPGTDSDWVHLQFHMALFELELGDREAAYRRFTGEILPLAACSRCALTDAPALLWRLELSAPEPLDPAWEPLRRAALADIAAPASSLTEAHDLLALAGAGDVDSLSRWLDQAAGRAPRGGRWIDKLGLAIHACLTGARETAALLIRRALPHLLREIGGSAVQHQTFELLAERCEWRSRLGSAPASIAA